MARVTRYLVDASAIIHLARIGELELLREILGRIFVTSEVAEEVNAGPEPIDLSAEAFPSWVTILPKRRRVPRLGLGRGEASLLVEVRPGDRLVIDDAQARAVAEARGLEFVGLLGLLVAASHTGELAPERALEVLDALVATEFRLAPGLYAEARRAIEQGHRRA